MSDIVTRLRNWVHAVDAVSASDLMDEAADEIERLSGSGDCPDQDNGINEDTVGRTLARRITGLQPMLEYREQIAILRADNNRRADLEVGLREGVVRLQAEVRRLEAVIATREPALTAEEREAVEAALGEVDGVYPETAATLLALLERVSLQNETPSIGENPTLTDDEREAISRELSWLQWCVDNRQIGDVGRKDIKTLRGLLERMA